MTNTGYCEYCQVETPCGDVTDVVGGAKDLLQYDFSFMGENLSMYVDLGDFIAVVPARR